MPTTSISTFNFFSQPQTQQAPRPVDTTGTIASSTTSATPTMSGSTPAGCGSSCCVSA